MGMFRRNLNDATAAYPFKMNPEVITNDIELYKDLFEEGVRLYGNKIIYIRQEYFNKESTFGEPLTKVLHDAHEIYAYVEETDAWGGSGDLFAKFGLRNTEEMTCHVPKNTFVDLGWFPRVGDVMYHVVAKSLWQIESVDDDKAPSFHPLSQFISYVFHCKSYLFDHAEPSKELMDDPNEHVEVITEVLFGQGDKIENAVETDVEFKNDPIEVQRPKVVDDTEKDPLGF